MKRSVVFAITLWGFLFSPFSQVYAGELLVAAAANLRYSFQELKTVFEQKTGHKVSVTFSSSGKLTAQAQNGAPFDIFLAANMKYPEALYESGIAASKPEVYARGLLVLWVKEGLNLKEKGSQVLRLAEVKRIALPNPRLAPYGEEGMRYLRNSELAESLKRKIIFAESISQVNNYLVTGAVEAGFTSKSSVLSEKMKGIGNWIDLDKDKYEPITQGMVILQHGMQKRRVESLAFRDFLLSEEAQQILHRYGYLSPR